MSAQDSGTVFIVDDDEDVRDCLQELAVKCDTRNANESIRAFAVHPGGIVETGLAKYISKDELRASGAIDENGKPIIDRPETSRHRNKEQRRLCGAPQALNLREEAASIVKTQISRVSTKDLRKLTINDLKDDKGVMPYAIDSENAHRLWELSEKLTGISASKTPG